MFECLCHDSTLLSACFLFVVAKQGPLKIGFSTDEFQLFFLLENYETKVRNERKKKDETNMKVQLFHILLMSPLLLKRYCFKINQENRVKKSTFASRVSDYLEISCLFFHFSGFALPCPTFAHLLVRKFCVSDWLKRSHSDVLEQICSNELQNFLSVTASLF